MRPFRYERPTSAAGATRLLVDMPTASLLAGGTNLLDLMKEDVARPTVLVDITRLPLTQIQATAGGISIGAGAKNASTANHPLIRQHYPLLAQAILAGASGQIRNMATNGGNLLQRTRCSYFYDTAMPCNKRTPGTGCAALEGQNRMHAIFGWSNQCVAVYPSDMAVALAALDATVTVQNAAGLVRTIPFADFHRLPGDAPDRDTILAADELIIAITLPTNPFADHSHYLKVRDRASYAFALVSVAAALELEQSDGPVSRIKQVRLAMGGVAHKPWRALAAEQILLGQEATEANFRQAAQAEMIRAKPLLHNAFKVELATRVLVRALQIALVGIPR